MNLHLVHHYRRRTTVVSLYNLTPSGFAQLAVAMVMIVSGVLGSNVVAAAMARRLIITPQAIRLINWGRCIALVAAATAVVAR